MTARAEGRELGLAAEGRGGCAATDGPFRPGQEELRHEIMRTYSFPKLKPLAGYGGREDREDATEVKKLDGTGLFSAEDDHVNQCDPEGTASRTPETSKQHNEPECSGTDLPADTAT